MNEEHQGVVNEKEAEIKKREAIIAEVKKMNEELSELNKVV